MTLLWSGDDRSFGRRRCCPPVKNPSSSNVPEPRFHFESTQEGNNRHFLAASGLLHGLRKGAAIDDPERGRGHFPAHRDKTLPLVQDGDSWASRDERLPASVEHGVGHDSDKGATHQRTAHAWSRKLFARNGE